MPSARTTTPRSTKRASARPAPAAAKPRKPAPTPELTMSDNEKRETLIHIAAYAFYERRGFVGGHELQDWLQAELEVDRQLAEPPKKPRKAKQLLAMPAKDAESP